MKLAFYPACLRVKTVKAGLKEDGGVYVLVTNLRGGYLRAGGSPFEQSVRSAEISSTHVS